MSVKLVYVKITESKGFDGMLELEKMPNIGKKLAKNFYKVGITTPEQLQNMDPKEAFMKLREVDSEACQLSCYAVAGAIEGVRWHDLPKEKKEEMKDFFKSLSIKEKLQYGEI